MERGIPLTKKVAMNHGKEVRLLVWILRRQVKREVEEGVAREQEQGEKGGHTIQDTSIN
jgi:hypothetical protein